MSPARRASCTTSSTLASESVTAAFRPRTPQPGDDRPAHVFRDQMEDLIGDDLIVVREKMGQKLFGGAHATFGRSPVLFEREAKPAEKGVALGRHGEPSLPPRPCIYLQNPSGRAPMTAPTFSSLVRRRLADEIGRMTKQAPFTVALTYPSPYGAGMSSLGYQRIYRAIMETPGLACERVFLDDEAETDSPSQTRPVTYESLRPLEDFPVIAVSVAYELEIAGLVRMLEAAGIPVRRTRARRRASRSSSPAGRSRSRIRSRSRGSSTPSSSAKPRTITLEVLQTLEGDRVGARSSSTRSRRSRTSSCRRITAPFCRRVAKVDDAMIPRVGSRSARRTPSSADMFLIETERGCSRACTYCVMRRSTNGGMRLASMETILGLIPQDAKRVGSRRRGGQRSPENRADREHARRSRARGRALVASPRSPERRVRRRPQARRLPHAHDRDGRPERAHARDPRAQGAHPTFRRSAPRWRASTRWTG